MAVHPGEYAAKQKVSFLTAEMTARQTIGNYLSKTNI
jgi:hypothetical protein